MELKIPIKVVVRGTCEIIRKSDREAMDKHLAECKQPDCAECIAIKKRLKG